MNNKSMVAVANTGDSSISIIDPLTWEENRRITLSPNSGPYSLVKCNSNHHVLVSQYYDDSLAYIDLLSGKVLESILLGRRPSHIAYDGERSLAFITNSDSDTMSIVCTQAMKLMGQIGVGSMPQGIDYNPYKGSLAIANVNSNDIWIVDAEDFSVKKVIQLDKNPFQAKYSLDGKRLYISCSFSQDEDIGTVITVDTFDYSISSQLIIGGMPGQLYNTRDGKYILATSMGKGGLEIIDLNKKKTLKKVSTNGMTHGMALDHEEKYVYVANTDDNSVSVIDWKLGKKILTIGVGKEPNGIVFV